MVNFGSSSGMKPPRPKITPKPSDIPRSKEGELAADWGRLRGCGRNHSPMRIEAWK
jgi:hypothetical protein